MNSEADHPLASQSVTKTSLNTLQQAHSRALIVSKDKFGARAVGTGRPGGSQSVPETMRQWQQAVFFDRSAEPGVLVKSSCLRVGQKIAVC